MRVIFAGTPEFAKVALDHLYASGHTIALVLTQPDRPAGRGMKLQMSAVKQYALQHGFPVAQPRSLRLDGKFPEDAADARQAISEAHADVMVVAAYGLILPQWVLDDMAGVGASQVRAGPPQPDLAPLGGSAAHAVASVGASKLGCLNIHASLLPRWRGAAPIHRAIEAGDSDTGITIMQMDSGLDTGNMLLVRSIAIDEADTTGVLHDRLAVLGGEMIVMALDRAAAGQLELVCQPAEGVTYAHKIEKQEAAIDWHQDARVLVRRIHAFNPFPGASATLNGVVIKIWAATVAQPDDRARTRFGALGHPCGAILALDSESIAVQAQDSIVLLHELQRPGGKRLRVADFLHGFALQVGMQFDLLP